MPASNTNPGQPVFSELLRSWRVLRKVSQTELSHKAGVSQRHLSFLESGRSQPSRKMVLLLAEALNLLLREQNALLAAAGFANSYSEHKIDNAQLMYAQHALQTMLKCHEPYGALVLDRNWNILMMNDANLRIFSLFLDAPEKLLQLGGDKPNIMRVVLHPDGLRPYIKNWQEFAGYFLLQLERELAANPFNRGAKSLLDEIKGYPDMPIEPGIKPDASQPFLPMVLAKGELELSFFNLISTFGTPQDVTLQELRIETFFPSNEVTESYIRQLR